jgi:hypothetical protein
MWPVAALCFGCIDLMAWLGTRIITPSAAVEEICFAYLSCNDLKESLSLVHSRCLAMLPLVATSDSKHCRA